MEAVTVFKISLLAAMDKDRVLGDKGSEKLLWHFKRDLQHFKSLTEGEVVIMGKSTFESLPNFARPLPNRVNLVLSRSLKGEIQGAHFGDFERIISLARNLQKKGKKVFVIGGASVYELFLKQGLVDKIYLTRIIASYKDKAKEPLYFPNFENDFRLTESKKDEESGTQLYFEKWEKNS